MEVTKRLAEFVCHSDFSDFNAQTLDYTKELCLSNLGTVVAGSRISTGKILARYAKEIGGKPESGVIGADFRTSAELAALVNGTSAHTTELEDDSIPDFHYTCHLIPAMFALGEKLKANGKTILESIILGFEVQSRLGQLHVRAVQRGFGGGPFLGNVGAAAAAAKMMGLGVKKTIMAISLGASHAAGLFRQHGSEAHFLEAGSAGRNGIASATLARYGITGDPNIIEGLHGLMDAVAGIPSPVFELGKPFRILQVGMKKYPCCYTLQRLIDGLLDLMNEYSFTYSDVAGIEVEGNSFFAQNIDKPRPTSPAEARFSMQHALAAVLLEGEPSLITFTDEKIHNPKFQETWKKIKVVPHPELEDGIFASGTMGNPVTVKLKNGKKLKKSCIKAHGDPPDLLSRKEVQQKYRGCVSGILSQKQAKRAADLLLKLETLPDNLELMQILTFPE